MDMKTTILSVNGNKPMNYLLKSVLSNKYDFLSVTDVFAAMDCLKKNDSISLIIIDLDCKTEENWDFIEYVTSSILFNKKIIALTDENSLTMEGRIAKAKVKDRFLKPFNPLDIVKKIDEVFLTEKLVS